MFKVIETKVQLIGYLGTDFEDVGANSGTPPHVRTTMATNETKEGKLITTWHNLDARGRLAMRLASLFAPGRRLFIEGSLRFVDQSHNGVFRGYTAINVTEIKVIDREDLEEKNLETLKPN